MARIRSIKPDFWTDEKVVELDYVDRLLFIGLWNFADDQGYIDRSPKRIKMQVFPGDNVDVSRGLTRLTSLGLLAEYDSPEGVVLHVTNWERHQRVSNPAKPRFEPQNLTPHAQSSEVLTNPREDSRVIGKGREGKGSISCAPATADDATETTPDRFDEFWDTYDKKRGRKKAEQKYRLALKRPGVTADLLIAAAGSYVAAQQAKGKHPEYTKDPATWLHGEHWEDEADAPTPDAGGWQTHWTPPPCPPEIADDPQRYADWLAEQRHLRAVGQ